jgi:hypothetical protein
VAPTSITRSNESDNGQAALLGAIPNGYDVYALGNDGVLTPTNAIPATPPAAVLNRMFDPLSSSLDPHAGGLGIYRPDFMLSANTVGDYNSPANSNKRGVPWSGLFCGHGDSGWSNR